MALIDATKKNKSVQTTNKTPVQTQAQIAQGQKVAAIIAGAETKKTTPVIQTTTEQRKQTEQRVVDLNTRTSQNNAGGAQNTDILTKMSSGEYGNGAKTLANEVIARNANKKETPEQPVVEEDTLDAKIRTIQESGKNQVIEIQNRLSKLSESMSGATQSLIGSIQTIYGARIQAMEKANDGMLKTKLALGQRGGRERYAPMLNASILTDEEIQGHERVAKLEGEMMAAIASAQQAQADNDYKLFNEEYDRVEAAQKNMTDQIMDLHKRAVDEENARIAREKAVREEQKAELEAMLDLSERSAPALAAKLSAFSTPEEQSAFISEYAKIQGIDPMVLFGDVETALTAQQKAAMDLERTYNLIQTSNRSAATAERNAATSAYNATTTRTNSNLAAEKKAGEDKIKAMNGDMSRELQAKSGSDGFVSPSDYKEARALWIEATGGASADFDKAFSGFVNPDDYYSVGFKSIE